MMKKDERANRHAVKSELDKLRNTSYNNDSLMDIEVPTVPIGNYYD